MDNNKLFETKKSRCPKCRKELIRLEPYSTKGISEFWCDDCNIKITIDDKNRDELNKELSPVDLLELNTMRMEEARFSHNTHYVTATGESIAYPETPLILQAFNNTDADLIPKSISRSDAEKILAEYPIDSVREVIDATNDQMLAYAAIKNQKKNEKVIGYKTLKSLDEKMMQDCKMDKPYMPSNEPDKLDISEDIVDECVSGINNTMDETMSRKFRFRGYEIAKKEVLDDVIKLFLKQNDNR